jgi:hypothetical protein
MPSGRFAADHQGRNSKTCAVHHLPRRERRCKVVRDGLLADQQKMARSDLTETTGSPCPKPPPPYASKGRFNLFVERQVTLSS